MIFGPYEIPLGLGEFTQRIDKEETLPGEIFDSGGEEIPEYDGHTWNEQWDEFKWCRGLRSCQGFAHLVILSSSCSTSHICAS